MRKGRRRRWERARSRPDVKQGATDSRGPLSAETVTDASLRLPLRDLRPVRVEPADEGVERACRLPAMRGNDGASARRAESQPDAGVVAQGRDAQREECERARSRQPARG